MNAPRVSVVMGVYNGAEHLPATIDSILAQTMTDFELLIVDDGSTDGTPHILRDQRDPRIRVIAQPNAGLTRALIAGCAAARAPLIARHDAGDLSHRERFARQCALFDRADVVFVSCATQYVGPDEEPLWVVSPGAAAVEPADVLDLQLPAALSDGPTHHGSVMFRRDAYERAGGYRAQFYYGQDFDLWYRLASLGKFAATDAILYTARLSPQSISGSAKREQEQLAKLSRAAIAARVRGESEEAILARAAAIGKAQRPKSAQGAGFYFIGEALRRAGNTRAARRYLRQAVAAQPFLLRAWIRWLQSLR